MTHFGISYKINFRGIEGVFSIQMFPVYSLVGFTLFIRISSHVRRYVIIVNYSYMNLCRDVQITIIITESFKPLCPFNFNMLQLHTY